MSENSVKEKSLQLSKENKIKFNLSSLIRIKDLYQLFEEEIKDDNYDYSQRFKNGSEQLTEFADYVFSRVFTGNGLDLSDIERFNALNGLAPEDDEYSSYQAAIAVNIVLIATNIIKIAKGEEAKIKSTIDYTLDVINNLKSEEFFTNNPDGDDDEGEEYLEQFYDQEISAEDKLINSIDNISQNDFISFNEENMIN